ncbi:MAG TPA: GtrA family protein [Candidatus Saccharimonadales bacterium]|nr:GtrA family protein [Candidatus Saccharimonadales bacterium]
MKQVVPLQTVLVQSHRRIIQFAEYFVGGMAYFWSGYIVFAVCYSGLHWTWLPAKMLADVVGWTLNYFIQRYWAFNDPSLNRREGAIIGKYGIITVVNFGLDYAIIWALNNIGISPYIGFFISAGFFTVWNYMWYRFWVFYGKRGGDAKEVA